MLFGKVVGFFEAFVPATVGVEAGFVAIEKPACPNFPYSGRNFAQTIAPPKEQRQKQSKNRVIRFVVPWHASCVL
jgi:hypothetical protein